jgi:hypothetical protein
VVIGELPRARGRALAACVLKVVGPLIPFLVVTNEKTWWPRCRGKVGGIDIR